MSCILNKTGFFPCRKGYKVSNMSLSFLNSPEITSAAQIEGRDPNMAYRHSRSLVLRLKTKAEYLKKETFAILFKKIVF